MNSKPPISIGFSPCPNDIFIFFGIIKKAIDLEGLSFKFFIEDIETLNKAAFNNTMDVTKLSFPAFGHVSKSYMPLNSGAALGKGCGPILVTKATSTYQISDIAKCKIGIPGKYTTAALLLTLYCPAPKETKELIFSDIEDAVVKGKINGGVIIHESRFTYQEKGLKTFIDLGACWEEDTGLPLPLGGIFIKNALPYELKKKVNHIIEKSVAFAMDNPKAPVELMKQYAQDMDEQVMSKHIALYVNEYTLDLMPKGRDAVESLMDKAVESGVIPMIKRPIFIHNL